MSLIKRVKDKTKLLSLFRLTIDKRHYLDVFIWADSESMYAASYQEQPYVGCYCGSDSKNGVLPPKLGEIHLVINDFGVGVVSHEILHAVLHWISANGLDWNGQDNEAVCYLNSDLNIGFWKVFYEHYEKDESGWVNNGA